LPAKEKTGIENEKQELKRMAKRNFMEN